MLLWACIAPHGGELIPELANGNLHRMDKTRSAMKALEDRCIRAAPETIIVYTPHGFDSEGRITVTVSGTTHGVVGGENGQRVAAGFGIDLELSEELSHAANEEGIPVAHALFDDEGKTIEPAPLDWGALVPLWFMGARWRKPPQIVVVCPSRSLSRRRLIEFGRITAQTAQSSKTPVALICSADQGHGHDENGPYGYAPASASYDRAYCRAIQQNDLGRLLHWREDWIESAMPDSYWQTLMLHGAMQHMPMQLDLLSYEAPTYFGMACVNCEPM